MRNSHQFDAKDAPHAVFPMGGIGAGSVGIGADGRLQDWEIFNRPAKGSVNGFTHFAVRAERDGKVLDTRILHGPFTGDRTGSHQSRAFNAFGFGPRRQQMTGFPSFKDVSLTGPYPVADLSFRDEKFPGNVKMRAFSPFVPLDDKASSMPAAMFEVTLENTTDGPLDYALIGCIAFDFLDIGAGSEVVIDAGKTTRVSGRTSFDSDHINHRQLCMSTDHGDVSYQHHLYRGNWFDAMEVYWKDISTAGKLNDRCYLDTKGLDAQNLNDAVEHSVMASHVTVPGGASKTIRMALTWYAPNVEKYWIAEGPLACCPSPDFNMTWRNYYATLWESAADVAADVLDQWDDLAARTVAFQNVLANTTLPDAVADAVSANISILKSPTVLRLEDGTFYGFEGCHPDSGCCEGSCTHVWNYQQALPFLFPALERSMRVADFDENQDPDTGGMAFRLSLPKGIGRSAVRPCADGHFGNVMKAYRDWKLSGDDEWLRGLWPQIKAAIEFAWHPENQDRWDPDQTGVLTGRQHHTLDMEVFGPNSWLAGFYLGALKAGAEMAKIAEDDASATLYDALFSKGKAWVGDNLFNGEWFQQTVDIKDKDTLAPFLTEKGQVGHMSGDIYTQYWSDEHSELKYQIDNGCAIDQVLAEWHARLYGIDNLFDPDQFATAVRSIFKYNFVENLGDLANPCRVFGMEDESGTMICSWPNGISRPVIPLPYSQETMHGFEYALGCQLMMIGDVDDGVRVFKAVRDRYKGHNRNPWNEIECGSNYARSMASFAAVPVLSGFSFDATAGLMGFAPKHDVDGVFRSIWSNGLAWGEVIIKGDNASVKVMGGELTLKAFSINDTVWEGSALAQAANLDFTNSGIRIGVGETLNIT